MIPGEFKPALSTLLLPPAGPLLLALLGLLLARTWRRFGTGLALAGILLTLVLSLHGTAVLLHRLLLDLPPPVTPAQLKDVQAIVVLGGGVEPHAPEYGEPQPSFHTLGRLRYGAWLARQTGKPLAFAGGTGWAAIGTPFVEGPAARRFLESDYGLKLRWLDDKSRDTQENAEQMALLLKPDGVVRIALVSDAWHLQRAGAHFRAAGFTVLPAPTQFVLPNSNQLMEWMPTADGLQASRQAIREWLGLRFAGPVRR